MRFLVFIFAFVLITVLFMINDEKLSKKAKIIITLIFVLCCLLAYVYETSFSKRSQNLNLLVVDFKQGKTLDCNGADVNSTNFEFSYGISSFIAKKDASKEFKNTIFKAKDCKRK